MLRSKLEVVWAESSMCETAFCKVCLLFRARFDSSADAMIQEQIVLFSSKTVLANIGPVVEGVGNYKEATQYKLYPNPLCVFGVNHFILCCSLCWTVFCFFTVRVTPATKFDNSSIGNCVPRLFDVFSDR